MRLVAALLLLAILLIPFLPPARAQPAKWTFMVYLDADNNLEAVGIDDFLEMASVGSTADVNIVVQMDRSLLGPPDGSRAYGDWTTARRYLIAKDMTPDAVPIVDMGEVNMGDPQTLIDFVTWGITAFPADHYFLVLWDHGIGWQGVVIDGSDYLTTEELGTALDAATSVTGRRVDVLGNDACRMTLEIMYQLRSYVDVFVGSEKDEPLEGWPYDTVLTRLAADPAMQPPELATSLVDAYVDSYVNQTPYSVTLSAVSSASLAPLADALDAFSAELLAYLPYFAAEVQDARGRTEHYEQLGVAGGNEYDLYHFTQTVEEEVGSPRLSRLAAGLRGAIEDAVIRERHWDNPNPVNQVPAKNAHGLGIFFPSTIPPNPYPDLLLSRNTTWDEFLAAYGGAIPIVRGLTASASSEDTDGDTLLDRIRVQATPEVAGTLAVEFTGPESISREVTASGGQETVLFAAPQAPGWYGVAVYLFESGKLRNMTVLPPVAVEARRVLSGHVVPPPTESGTATLRNLRSGAQTTAPLVGGDFAVTLLYPTWIRDGDALDVTVEVGGRSTSFTWVPDLRASTNNVTVGLSPGGSTAWTLDLVALALGIAVGMAVTLGAMLVRSYRPPRREAPSR